MIHGVYALIYTKNAEAVRAFFRDVLELRSVDTGDGWLVFELPPAEADFGWVTTIELPGGGVLGLYQPKHKTALPQR